MKLAGRMDCFHHSPAQLKSRRKWSTVTDRQMLEFSIQHFDRLGYCMLSPDELGTRRWKPILQAMLYHFHARFQGDGCGNRRLALIGQMYDIRNAKTWIEEFGLIPLSYDEWRTKQRRTH